jgi:hypothetical protein
MTVVVVVAMMFSGRGPCGTMVSVKFSLGSGTLSGRASIVTHASLKSVLSAKKFSRMVKSSAI